MAIRENLEIIRNKINQACSRSNRQPADVLLLGVSKGQSVEAICAAGELGIDAFGENRVQEARLKIGECPRRFQWHMIGHLQSNKCRDVVQGFQMIQSVDSMDLARELDSVAQKAARHLQVLLQVNVAGEATKFGFKPEQVLADLIKLNELPRLEIHGLMTIAPYTPDPEKVRPVFARLRDLKAQCEDLLGAPLPHLSMGMSGDYEVAIEEGATIVRIGTALFGERTLKARRSGPE